VFKSRHSADLQRLGSQKKTSQPKIHNQPKQQFVSTISTTDAKGFTVQRHAFSQVCNALTPKHPIAPRTSEVQESRCALLINVSFQESTPLATVMTTGAWYHLQQLKGTTRGGHSEIWKPFMLPVLPAWLILISHFTFFFFPPTLRSELHTLRK